MAFVSIPGQAHRNHRAQEMRHTRMAAHSHSHGKATEEIPSMLREAGLKVTKPRVALLQIMMRDHGPFTAEEMHERLSKPKNAAHCDLVTIYRCLSKFESLGLVTRCDFGDGTVRYEILHKGHHHHHIICRVCKKVEPLPECPVDDRSFRFPKMGYKEVIHRLEFFGVCPSCHAQETSM